MTEESGSADNGPEAQQRRTVIIVAAVVLVLLLCCCLILVLGWLYGDTVVEQFSRVAPGLLLAG